MIDVDLSKLVSRYQQQLADAQLRASVAETLVEQYKAALDEALSTKDKE